MRRTMQFGRVLLTASLGLMLCASKASAGEMDFSIITSESSLTITLIDTTTVISSGQITKGVYQVGNTNTTALAGTIGATISGYPTINGSQITFGGDTTITALNAMATVAGGGSGAVLSFKPGVGGISGSCPPRLRSAVQSMLIIQGLTPMARARLRCATWRRLSSVPMP